ncbi:MAG TPA: hypothetical protein V6D11_17535 [Waterburya sp.]|jgi:hypothetical protein
MILIARWRAIALVLEQDLPISPPHAPQIWGESVLVPPSLILLAKFIFVDKRFIFAHKWLAQEEKNWSKTCESSEYQ